MNNTITLNSEDGVLITGERYTIGTSAERSAASNAIFRNNGWQVNVARGVAPSNPQATGRRIQGNYFGVSASGLTAQPNGQGSVAIGGERAPMALGFVPDPTTALDTHSNQHGPAPRIDDDNGGGGGSAPGSGEVVTVPRPTPVVRQQATAVTRVAMPRAGSYRVGDLITVSVTFSRAVTVAGTPRISMTLNGVARQLVYQRGSRTNTLVFTYQVTSADRSGVFAIHPRITLPARAAVRDAVGSQALLAFPSAPSPVRMTIAPAIARTRR